MSTTEVNFDDLNLNISPFIKSYPIELQRDLYEYLSGLDEKNRKGYEIAYDHLGSSFNISRSNGFKNWLSKRK